MIEEETGSLCTGGEFVSDLGEEWSIALCE